MFAGQRRAFAGLDGLAPGYGVRMWGVVIGSRRSSMEAQGVRHMHPSDDCVACSRMLMWLAGRWQLHKGGSHLVSQSAPISRFSRFRN